MSRNFVKPLLSYKIKTGGISFQPSYEYYNTIQFQLQIFLVVILSLCNVLPLICIW
jgi:hypothetical protein